MSTGNLSRAPCSVGVYLETHGLGALSIECQKGIHYDGKHEWRCQYGCCSVTWDDDGVCDYLIFYGAKEHA